LVLSRGFGRYEFIHPEAKDVPCERLALPAAALDDPRVDAGFRAFKEMRVKDGKARIHFSEVGGGIETRRVVMNIDMEGTGSLPRRLERMTSRCPT
jgi:hypothetical protein